MLEIMKVKQLYGMQHIKENQELFLYYYKKEQILILVIMINYKLL